MTACGGGSGERDKATAGPSEAPDRASSTTPKPEEERKALRRAVEILAASRVAGDPDEIEALLSDYCQHRLIVGWFAEYLEVRELGYPPQPELSTFTATIDGKDAYATYRFTDARRLGAREEKWYLQDGEWRQDECFD